MPIEKRFPANTTLNVDTFLNDKKIDGELYSYLQQFSYPDEEKRTIIKKEDLPVQREICDAIGVKSPKTYRAHLSYLIQAGLVVEEKDKFILPNQEEIFFMIPLDTLMFINDSLQEQVVKTYIYLGQKWKYKGDQYLFSLKELGEHLGIKINDNHNRDYIKISNALICLKNLNLVDWEDVWYINEKGHPIPYKRLTKFSIECPV